MCASALIAVVLAAPALADSVPAGLPAAFVKAQASVLGLDPVNDKIALGSAHLLCREAVAAATVPAIPGSESRRAARAAYDGLAERLAASERGADALLVEGLRDAGQADASAETVAALADRAHKGLASRLFQVNPATAQDIAITCRTLAASSFETINTRLAAR
ncbi:hypothetical protein DKG74_18660 [Zavarzinia aquatilis]|uniref:Uncharacterized protein n=2 Tax=Zavarzinia aquatilis TaxID=2211142 RepID=A0A317E0F9_9PROT|nr:hypothetical protein DKG74_18660 [Zavarzinia aquatilis]